LSNSKSILQAVHTIHEERIVHSDLKPANFLVVEGQLKLIDFGIAKAISSDTTSIAREAQVCARSVITSPDQLHGFFGNVLVTSLRLLCLRLQLLCSYDSKHLHR
jgi:serine/threonine-protein kinase TTK/MPS1